jgi:hypothetical protein
MGRTPGEALDALAVQLNDEDRDTLIIVRHLRADSLFTEQDRIRLADLMTRWRAAREAGLNLPIDEQDELDRLVDAELSASAARASALSATP